LEPEDNRKQYPSKIAHATYNSAHKSVGVGIAMWDKGEVDAISNLVEDGDNYEKDNDNRQGWIRMVVDIKAKTKRQKSLSNSTGDCKVFLPRYTISDVYEVSEISA